MIVQRISHGLATFVANPQECALLARACDEATGHGDLSWPPARDFIETAGAAFRSASMAADAQNHLTPDQQAQLLHS